jgi:hypothetical protein
MSESILGSQQLFSGFWNGWMIEHPTKTNSKNPIILDVKSTLKVKNPKKLDFWIGFDFLVQFNSIQSKNPTFLDVWSCIWFGCIIHTI